MVERPIKKSERQQAANGAGEANLESSRSAEGDAVVETQSGSRKNPAPSFQGKGKGKGKGAREEERPSQVSPALMRGPKPMKLQPPLVKAESEPEPEATVDEIESTETSES